MTTTFDALFESMLSEMMPASMMDDMGTATSKVTKKVEELPGKSQHWGPLQKLSPEARGEIVRAIIKTVFADNDENTYSTTIDNPEQLKDAIKTAIRTVAEKNPDFKAAGKWAAQFLADRLSNKELLGNVKYTTMGGDDILQKDATQKEVKQALKKALEQAPATEEAPEQATETEPAVEKAKPSKEYSYNPSADYYLKSYEEIPSGTLKGDTQVAYDRLSGMAGEAHSGGDFAKTLKNSQMSTSFLKQLFDLGVLEFAETDSEDFGDVGDTEGFDKDIEKYMSDLTKDARRDYEQSSPGSRFGGEDVFG